METNNQEKNSMKKHLNEILLLVFSAILILIGFTSVINIFINIFEKKENHFSYVIYFIIFLLIVLLLFLINLDIPLVLIIANKDKYFVIWLIFFTMEFLIVNINRINHKRLT